MTVLNCIGIKSSHIPFAFTTGNLIKKLNAKRFLKHIIKVNDVSALRYAIIKLKSEEYKV